MSHFWNRLPRPIKALAPMENVTDTVFRRLIAACGAPDVFFTEFTNVDWMFTNKKLRARSVHRLEYSESERPLVVQVWGSQPENYFKAAQEMQERGFDGIDINMGCPAPKIRRKLSCSGLIRDPSLAGEIIQATKEGAGPLPVSVKTRLGLDMVITEEWCGFLLEQDLDVLIVHGRIASEMSKYPADWDELGKVVRLRDQLSPRTLVLGNGDVQSLVEIEEKYEEFGVDGVMVGRGIFQDPYLFHPVHRLDRLNAKDKMELLWAHTSLFQQVWGDQKDFNILKKFYKIFTTDFEGHLELREALMKQKDPEGVWDVLRGYHYEVTKEGLALEELQMLPSLQP